MITDLTPPPPVRRAVQLMWVGAAVTVVGLVVSIANRDATRQALESEPATAGSAGLAVGAGIAVAVVLAVVQVALWALSAVFNARGKQWARVLSTVLGGLGVVSGVLGLAFLALGSALAPLTGAAADVPGQGLSTGLSVVTTLLAAAVLVLLWRPVNAPFYAAGSQPRP